MSFVGYDARSNVKALTIYSNDFVHSEKFETVK